MKGLLQFVGIGLALMPMTYGGHVYWEVLRDDRPWWDWPWACALMGLGLVIYSEFREAASNLERERA